MEKNPGGITEIFHVEASNRLSTFKHINFSFLEFIHIECFQIWLQAKLLLPTPWEFHRCILLTRKIHAASNKRY